MDLMRSTQTMTEEELHSLSDNYDSIFLHPVRTGCSEKRGGGGDERAVFAFPVTASNVC